MVDQRETALSYIRMNGPVLPVHIAKHLKTEILFASAILSELSSSKKLKLTKKAIGGSPLYYIPGQESLLFEKLGPTLKGPEKEVYDLLEEKKVLYARDLEPTQRIALSNMKDFAKQIDFQDQGINYKFWKHFLTQDKEAEEIISTLIKPEKKTEIKEEPKKELQPVIKEIEKVVEKQKISPDIIEKIKQDLLKELKPKDKQTKLKEVKLEGRFYNQISNYFKSKSVVVLDATLVKKDKDFNFIINLPSNIGHLRYYVKAINKKKLNETDVSLAYAEGQHRKLPTVLLSSGELTKKAQDQVHKLHGQLTFKKI